MTQDLDVANLGLARPPLVYMVSIATGALLEFAWPLALLPRPFAAPLGILLGFAAVLLLLRSVGNFRPAGPPRRPAQPAGRARA
jgi:hypothetical protein